LVYYYSTLAIAPNIIDALVLMYHYIIAAVNIMCLSNVLMVEG